MNRRRSAQIIIFMAIAGVAFFSCNKGGGIISDAITFALLINADESDNVASVTVGFLSDAASYELLNIVADLNADGQWQQYSIDNGTQDEWIVKNMPLAITATEYTTFFSLLDADIISGDAANLRVVISAGPVTGDDWDGSLPAGAVALDEIVTVEELDAKNNVDPADGYYGVGGSEEVLSDRLSSGLKYEREGDLNLETLFYRPDMPDLQQGTNSCVLHSITNSLVWLAEKNNFTDKLQKVLTDAETDTNISTAEGQNDFAYALGDTLGYNPASGVKTEDIIPKKQQFATDNQLPITTEKIGSDNGVGTFEAIQQAMKDDCDVEVGMIIDGKLKHMVTVVGFADIMIGDKPYRSITVHDSDTESFNDLYELQEDKLSFNNYPFRGKKVSAKLTFAIKECPKSTETSMLQVDPESYAFVHVIGGTSCPQTIGELAVTSSGSELNWNITTEMPWLSFSQTSGTTPSTLNVLFNCDINPVAQILTGSFDVSDGDESIPVDVSGDVQ
jgi:hypothetical protein